MPDLILKGEGIYCCLFMKKFLLCPPTYFNIEYEINPWMHIENKVTPNSVNEEYTLLKQTYLELSVQILEIPPQKGLPDMVYTANLGFAKDNIFIVANFKFPQRQKESIYSEQFFSKLGFEIKKLPPEIPWEGEGDFLKAGNKYFMGHGKRSSLKAKDYLSEILQGQVVPLKLIDPYFYHLDMCFFPLDANTVTINPRSFEPEGVETIRQHFKTVIETSPEDNQTMACNAEIVGNTIVVAESLSQELKDKYGALGYKTKELPMYQYIKGGGSIKCLSLEFH